MRTKDRAEQLKEWEDIAKTKPKIKTNIKMRVTPEQSIKVQEICFNNELGWGIAPGIKKIGNLDKPFLFIENRITYTESENYFKSISDKEEIDADIFIRTNGTCIVENQETVVNETIKEVIEEDYKNSHYKTQKIDTVARCKANMTLEQQKAICIFNCDKYLHREKGQNLSDIQKVRYYLDWLEEIEIKLSCK